MGRFKTKLFLSILSLILLANLAYPLLLLNFSEDILPPEELAKLRSIITPLGLLITTLATAAALLLSFFLARRINRPLNELVKAAKAIANREFKQYIKVSTYNEIEELVTAFNNMSEQLKTFEQETKRRNQTLEKAVKERTKELNYIYKIGREVSSTLELDNVLDTIVKRTTEVLGLKVCTILLVDEIVANKLRVAWTEGINLKKIEQQVLRKTEGISGWVWDKEEVLLVNDLNHDPRFIGRKKEKYYTGSLISVPLEAKGRIIGIINANNKLNGEIFKDEDLLLLQEIAAESAIAIENALLYKSLKEIYVHTISALARALEAKDHYSRSHSENVTKYALAIAKEVGLGEQQIEILRQACQLHDLGKIGIHDYILTKTSKLSADEWEEIKTHALRGAQILQPIGFLNEVANLVRQHHERFDGKGYPLNLSGEDIQLGARIMAIADAFDAMLSERPYRQALDLSDALTELKNNSGTQFDPQIVDIFLRILKTNPELINNS